MLIIGLTGSIGMGKSTTANMLRAAGVPVHDADDTVHRLYSGRAAPLIEAAFPGTVREGAVDRAALGQTVLGKPEALKRLEAIVHPLVQEEEQAFLATSRKAGHRAVVLDIPLLFEVKGEARVDMILLVTAPSAVQKARVLARPGMTEAKFAAIVQRQMPDEEKRRRAHAMIDTSRGLEAAKADITAFLKAVSGMTGGTRAFSGEVDTGSREENAKKQ